MTGDGADTIDAGALTADLILLTLSGGAGADRLIGSPFADVLDGGADGDTVTGGEGSDTFLDTNGGTGTDTLEETFADENEKLYRASFGAQFVSGLIMPTMMFIGNLNYVVIAVLGGLKVANGSISR